MAKNDMPGMKGQPPTNPYEGMWGPIGGGNAAPYGGNSMPWLQAQQAPSRIPGMLGGGMQRPPMPQMDQQNFFRNLNPNAAFNRAQQPGQGQQQGQPFLKPPIAPNDNGNAIPDMAAASSIGPSQNQGLLEALMKASQGAGMVGGMMGGGGIQEKMPMAGGNIPPDAGALQASISGIGNMIPSLGNMARPAVEPGRTQLDGQEIAGYGAPPSPMESSVAPTSGGSFWNKLRQLRNG